MDPRIFKPWYCLPTLETDLVATSAIKGIEPGQEKETQEKTQPKRKSILTYLHNTLVMLVNGGFGAG